MLLLVAGYLAAGVVYFVGPRLWLMPVEIWIYRLPGILHAKLLGVMVVGVVWLWGVVLLCRRGVRAHAVPWGGLGWAAASPGFMIFGNMVFLWLARHVAPLSL